MRHGNSSFRKLSRTSSHRRAMYRNMAASLFLHERIETTVPKAKDLRRVAEKLITTARTDTVAARRQVAAFIQDASIVRKLFSEIAPRYLNRKGGYTRIVRTRIRVGDAAPLASIGLV